MKSAGVLTSKETRFVEEYLVIVDPRQATLAGGYSRSKMKALFRKAILVLTLILSLPIPAMAEEDLGAIIQLLKKTEFSQAAKDTVTKIESKCADFFDKEVEPEARCAAGFASIQASYNEQYAAMSAKYRNDLISRLNSPKNPEEKINPSKELASLYKRDGIENYAQLEARRKDIASMLPEFQQAIDKFSTIAFDWRQKAIKLVALNESIQKKRLDAAKAGSEN